MVLWGGMMYLTFYNFLACEGIITESVAPLHRVVATVVLHSSMTLVTLAMQRTALTATIWTAATSPSCTRRWVLDAACDGDDFCFWCFWCGALLIISLLPYYCNSMEDFIVSCAAGIDLQDILV